MTRSVRATAAIVIAPPYPHCAPPTFCVTFTHMPAGLVSLSAGLVWPAAMAQGSNVSNNVADARCAARYFHRRMRSLPGIFGDKAPIQSTRTSVARCNQEVPEIVGAAARGI